MKSVPSVIIFERGSSLTSQSVNRPLLELLQSDVCCGRHGVEVESVRVCRFLVTRVDKLPFAVVDMASFRVNPIVVLPEHLDPYVLSDGAAIQCLWSKEEKTKFPCWATRRDAISAI